MEYRLGLDIGMTSIGWAILEHDSEESPMGIIDLGVRIFDAAEHPKDGSALAVPRREARGSRRRLRRHRHRLERIKFLCQTNGLMSIEEIEDIYHNSRNIMDIYQIRYEALDRQLNREEWIRILIHLAQRRGFKSNRKDSSKDKETGKLLDAVKNNRSLMEERGYRTVGEMFYLDEKFSQHKRNKSEDYSHTVAREQVLKEIAQIFTAQRKLKNKYASQSIEDEYIKIFSGQRSFDEGPGLPSPYGGNQIEKMVGRCTFENDLPRAPKACYSFEIFNLLQKINSIRIESSTGERRTLNKVERDFIIQLAHSKSDLNYNDIRKTLSIDSDIRFNSITYGLDDPDETEKKTKFNYLKAYHDMRKALDKVYKGRIKALSTNQLDTIGTILTLYKNDQTITDKMKENGLNDADIDALITLPFRKFSHLSLKAIHKIIPHLEVGHVYSEAAALAGYNFRSHDGLGKSNLLPLNTPELDDITNPVVRRAVSQSIKVINAVIRKYGSPQLICLEMTREMGKNFRDRKKIEQQIRENTERNEQIKNKIVNFGHKNPSGQDIVKMKLWEEQDGRCAYSGVSIPIERLFEAGIADVDHIIPYSVCYDDSYANKALVTSEENRQKGNRLPYEYMKNDQAKLERFTVWCNTNVRNYRKRQRLLKQSISEDDRNLWKERQLNDTKYISRFMLNYIRDHLELAPVEYLGKRQVIAVNGSITAYMRKRWGLKKIREEGDLHHAMDAAVVACVSEGMIRKITRYSQRIEAALCINQLYDYETGELIPNETYEVTHSLKFPLPWEDFRNELLARLSDDPSLRIRAYKLKNYLNPDQIEPIFVSRMPKHKNRGAAHKETVYSPRLANEGLTVSKVPITKLKLSKDGEIECYYEPHTDIKLYEALKAQLLKYGGKADAAFKEPFYKPAAPGKPASPVKKVKIIDKSNLNVPVHNGNGIAANGDMLRIDVFQREEGFYWVPIYVSDIVKDTLPNKAVVAYKPYKDWTEMEDSSFLFSLYPNDLIRFTHRRGVDTTLWDGQKVRLNEAFMYFVSAGISTGSVSVRSHDNSSSIPSLGLKTLTSLEKWHVDVLGNKTLVKKEKRQYFPGQREG